MRTGITRAQRRPPARTALGLRHEIRLLPHVSLNFHGVLGGACRERFDGRSLREAAEFVRDCETGPGTAPDAFTSLLEGHSGSIGAKQALLAALALEVGRRDVQLMVACCEMRLPDSAWPARTLPMAVCWLNYRGRRLQIVEPRHASLHSLQLVTEVAVEPSRLVAERMALYASFSADWCRALEIPAPEFARLRARQLGLSAGTSAFEDLLGYALKPEFAPAL